LIDGRCKAMKIAAFKCFGREAMSRVRGVRLPAEPPMTMMLPCMAMRSKYHAFERQVSRRGYPWITSPPGSRPRHGTSNHLLVSKQADSDVSPHRDHVPSIAGRRPGRNFQLNLPGCIVVLLLMLSGQALVFAASADPFDTPVDKKVVDFGLSPYYLPGSDIHVRLSCFIYPAFMVKEYDEGQKGAEWIAVARIGKGKAPQCSKSHEQGEWVLDQKEWDGYFMGVKGDMAFFRAADGIDGGMPFAIFDAKTRKKIFSDSFKFEDSPFNDIRVERTDDGQVVLRYLRVKGTFCDLYPEKVRCWEPTRKKLGIRSTAKPVCKGYEDTRARWGSAVAYPVEVVLFPKPVRKNVDGPVTCWPVDYSQLFPPRSH